jgi:hypothetical protein
MSVVIAFWTLEVISQLRNFKIKLDFVSSVICHLSKRMSVGISCHYQSSYGAIRHNLAFPGNCIQKRQLFQRYKGEKNVKGDRHGYGILYDNFLKVYEGSWLNGKRYGVGVQYGCGEVEYNGEWKDDQYHGYGIRSFKGNVYTGQFENNLEHGKGIFRTFDDFKKYSGDWKRGRMEGKGELQIKDEEDVIIFRGNFKDGNLNGSGYVVARCYLNVKDIRNLIEKKTIGEKGTDLIPDYKNLHGNFKYGKLHGRGMIIDNNGRYYGQCNHGKRHGIGRFESNSQNYSYYGHFQNDVAVGFGKLVLVEGGYSVGYFNKQLKLHGQGIIKFPSGGLLRGSFEEGIPRGSGIQTFPSGDVYEGECKLSILSTTSTYLSHGKGKMTYANGDVYDGDWSDGKRNGIGSCLYFNGGIYVGDWIKGTRTGKGKMTYANGHIYDGDWLDGKHNGTGSYLYPDGGVYVGEWIKGKPSGKGKLSLPCGTVYDGNWANGSPNGTLYYCNSNGESYDGEWIDGFRDGKGCFRSKDGQISYGTWKGGKEVKDHVNNFPIPHC